MFVHLVRDGEIVFQNDHSFVRIDRQRLRIPMNISPGSYSIIIGLWDREKNQRIHIKGLKGSKVEIGVLEVSPKHP